jgi:hypothetical protein
MSRTKHPTRIPSEGMRKWVIVVLLVVLVVASAGTGYLVGVNQPSLGRCTPWGGSGIAGINVTVSYQGNWRLSVAEFASNQTRASTLDSVCYYEGSGTISFYFGYANYNGWNTVMALAHKWGTTGTLTVTVMVGPSMSSNSTATSYGDASTSLSFLV